jgi:xylose isomerase
MSSRKYAVILGNLGNTRDRFCSGYKTNPSTAEMLKKAAAIPRVDGIELVGTWDITSQNAKEMKKMFDDCGKKCASIIPDLFADKVFWKGSYSSKDARVRQHSIDYTSSMAEAAMIMNCDLLNIWPGQDGYDYMLTADYENERAWLCDAIVKLATEFPQIRFALEYKPKEPRTHSYIARMGDSLLLAAETECKNVGVCIDTGHSFNAGENVGEAVVLARRAGDKLMHMHFNDNYTAWDDDMIVGSVHAVCYIELLYWLDRCEYHGYLSMDQYPYREDAAGAIGESIEWLVKFDSILQVNRKKIDELLKIGDAVETSRFLRNVL